MSLPTVATTLTAAQTVASIAALDQNQAGNLQEARALFEDYRGAYKRAEAAATAITASGANIGALKTVFETAKGSSAVVCDIFKVAGTGDTTDTVLATAKGSAPAAGNLFRWTKVTATETLEYVGPSSATAFTSIDAALVG